MPRHLTACLLAVAALPAHAGIVRDVGVATDRAGHVLYTETHYLPGEGMRTVLYRCPDGRAFARKRVDGNGPVPDFAFVDGRDGYEEGVQGQGATRTVYWRASAGAARKQGPVSVQGTQAFDAGFDALVRQRWATLDAGSPLKATFLLPSRLATRPVVMQRSGPAGGSTLELTMSLDSWYGFAAPDTHLRYRRNDHRLLEFEGLGTIRSLGGDRHPVHIRFAPSAHTGDVPRSELDAALAAPLDGRCTT